MDPCCPTEALPMFCGQARLPQPALLHVCRAMRWLRLRPQQHASLESGSTCGRADSWQCSFSALSVGLVPCPCSFSSDKRGDMMHICQGWGQLCQQHASRLQQLPVLTSCTL